ncbi:hypothetical protein J6590_014558 [Homalodisca vitripennis]|nr:hypothetical protein J6590_014558 [Homalodisca vitripennis]
MVHIDNTSLAVCVTWYTVNVSCDVSENYVDVTKDQSSQCRISMGWDASTPLTPLLTALLSLSVKGVSRVEPLLWPHNTELMSESNYNKESRGRDGFQMSSPNFLSPIYRRLLAES